MTIIMLKFLEHNKDITHFSNFKTPAITRYFYEIKEISDIANIGEIYEFCRQKWLPYIIVSWGTNCLFAFDVFPGVVIKNSLYGWEYDVSSEKLTTYSQELIWNIAESLETDYGQDLWHRFIGLPGTIGGAIFWNAGCFGLEIENNFSFVHVYDIFENKEIVLNKEDMEFSYRDSILKRNSGRYFIISACFDLSEKKEKYQSDVDNIYFREHKQPKWNSCWSFFKNPSKEYSAGKLIEEVGLKWFHLWGAYFSEKHANFLMHDGKGTYRDLLNLIDEAVKRVQERFKITLENEVRIIYPEN